MKPFLILQLRPEDAAADDEYAAFLAKGGIGEGRAHRIRLDQAPLPPDLDLDAYAGVIVGGGPGCLSDDPATKDPVEARIEAEILSLMPEVTARDIPFLGCCYGIGILAHHLGAEVSKRRFGEPVGAVEVEKTVAAADDPLLEGLPDRFDALVGHKEAVQDLPPGCVPLLTSRPCPFQMIRHGSNVYATQFHPESGPENFALRIEVYRHKGYFPPEEAEALTAAIASARITVPQRILRRFVARYG
jgi:GMP synthase (glutamine-hydrolysing)